MLELLMSATQLNKKKEHIASPVRSWHYAVLELGVMVH